MPSVVSPSSKVHPTLKSAQDQLMLCRLLPPMRPFPLRHLSRSLLR
jgi:hypothetical protein